MCGSIRLTFIIITFYKDRVVPTFHCMYKVQMKDPVQGLYWTDVRTQAGVNDSEPVRERP